MFRHNTRRARGTSFLIYSLLLGIFLVGFVSCTEEKSAQNPADVSDKQIVVEDKTNNQPITIGLLPDEKSDVLLERFEPVRASLEKHLKRPVKVVFPSLDQSYTYDDLVDYFVDGKVQIAYFGGLSFIRALNRTPAAPLIMRKKDTKFRSYFIARAEKKATSLQELKGTKFAFGSRSSTSGHLMPRYFLKQKGIDPEKDFNGEPRFSGAHDKTLQWVVSGRVDAGALNSAVFDRLLRAGKIDPDQVEVVWATPGYADYIWAVREDVPSKVQKQITKFFRDLTPGNDEDDILLKALSADYYVVPNLKDFDKLSQIATELKLIKAE